MVILFRGLLFLLVMVSLNLLWAKTPTGKTVEKNKSKASIEKEVSDQVINVVLFSDSSESWTGRDFQLFALLKQELLKKDLVSQYSDSVYEDFMMTRLVAREAKLFDLTPTPFVLSDAIKKKLATFSTNEVQNELEYLGLATNLVDIKENQLKQKLRFKTWVEALKKKYQVKWKWTPSA